MQSGSMRSLKQQVAPSFYSILSGLILLILFWVGHATFYTRMPGPGACVELYSQETQDDLQKTFSKVITSARDSILLMIYSLSDTRVVNALRLQSEKGIDVKIICDAKASKGVWKRLGSKCRVFLRKGRGLMHQKILVIDKKKVWLGSANMTTNSLTMHGNLVVGFDSPDLAAMITEKADAMITVGRVKSFPPQEFFIGGQRVEMWFFPDNPEGSEKILNLIKGAKKSVKVAMFTWTRKDFADEVRAAKERGIETAVIIDRNSSKRISSKVVKHLLSSNVSLRLNKGNGLLHHKFLVVDDKILVNGSANWTQAAFEKNDDCFVIIHELTEKQNRFLKRLWKNMIRESESAIDLQNRAL